MSSQPMLGPGPQSWTRLLRRCADSAVVRAWVGSRLICWVVGVVAVAVLGAHAGPHDPGNLTAPFGTLGNQLVAPAARWDAHWYLLIAEHGYPSLRATAFYPLYPWAASLVGLATGSVLVGGLIVSLASTLVALLALERLVALELGPRLAVRTTMLLAFFPVSVFFSADYTEGLFLALTIGAILAARTGRWPVAGVAGGLAAMTRPTGLLVLVPLVLLYVYGPREDRPGPVGALPASPAGTRRRHDARWPARHRLERDVLWMLGVPAGLGVYVAFLGITMGHPFAMLGQNQAWHQTFTLPPLTIGRAAVHAAQGLLNAAHGHAPNDVFEFGFLVMSVAATVGALRRLPVAYGAYAAVGIVMITAFPFYGQSLSGFSRYVAPLFPILMWLAAWTSERRLFRPLLIVFGLLMVAFTVRFATWHYIG